MFLGLACLIIQSGNTSSATLIISEPTVYENQTIDLQENIWVEETGTLIFKNCSVLMNGSLGEDINISVDKGGELHIVNSSFRRISSESFYHFFMEGDIHVDSSVFHDIGGRSSYRYRTYSQNTTYGMLIVDSMNSRFDNVTFQNDSSDTVLICDSSSIVVNSVNFSHVNSSIHMFESTVSIENSKMTSEESDSYQLMLVCVESDIEMNNSYLSLEYYVTIGLYTLNSSAVISNSVFHGMNFSQAIYSRYSSLTVSSCNFTNITQGIIDIENNSYVDVSLCVFQESDYAIFLSMDGGIIRNSTFTNCIYGIYFKGVWPTSSDNVFINVTHPVYFGYSPSINVVVYLEGDYSEVYDFAEGIIITEANGTVISDRDHRYPRSSIILYLTPEHFSQLNPDPLITPVHLKAYYKHNFTTVQTTLGELVFGEMLNITIDYYREPLPDLSIRHFTISETEFHRGDSVTISAVVVNEGNLAARSVHIIISLYREEEIFSTVIDEIGPGQQCDVTITWYVKSEWGHSILIQVDPNDTIQEFDEFENTDQMDISLRPELDQGLLRVGDEGMFMFGLMIFICIGIYWWGPWKKDEQKKK